jgi:Amt family ammonium transporter
MWGLLAVVFSNPTAHLSAQLIGAIFTWVLVSSLLVWLVIKVVMGLRVSEEEEYSGVDLAECGLEAYPEFISGK